MTKKSLEEIMDENKKILIAEYQKGFLAGFEDAEKKAEKKNLFEKKIRWYLENIEDSINIETLNLIKMAKFNEKGRLVFKVNLPLVSEKKEKNLPKKKQIIEYGDIYEIARKMDRL